MSLEKLRNSQVGYLRDWRNSLIDLEPQVTRTGYLSYIYYLDDRNKIAITKEIDKLNQNREKKYYACELPTCNTIMSMKHNRLFVIQVMKNIHYLKAPILEISCFNGWLGQALSLSSNQYVGIDPSSIYFNDDYLFIEAAAELIPFKDNQFNTVISKDSIDHYYDIKKSINEIHRVLKPGGHFILGLQVVNIYENMKNIFRLLRKTILCGFDGFLSGIQQWKNGRKIDDKHYHHFSPKEVKDLLIKEKFMFRSKLNYGLSKVLFIFQKRA